MSEKRLLNPDWPRATSGPFAMATQVGDTIYVSGQVAQDARGDTLAIGDLRGQAHAILDNIEVILALGGASLDDVVRITTYITDMQRYGEWAAVRAERFPDAALSSATVAVSALVRPEYLIEIEATAVVGCG